MKKVYVYRDGEMVLKETAERLREAPIVCEDLPDFVSTVDGRVIHGRAGLRRHNKELGVTFTEDYKGEWESFQKKREKLFKGEDNDPKRLEKVVRAYNELEEKERRKRRY